MTNNLKVFLASLVLLMSINYARAEDDDRDQEAYRGKSSAYINASEKYANDITKRLKKEWKPSHIQGDHHISVLFVIGRDGTVKDMRIANSNAPDKLNQDALSAVVAASPFDPLPTILGDEFVMEFTFNYKRNWK